MRINCIWLFFLEGYETERIVPTQVETTYGCKANLHIPKFHFGSRCHLKHYLVQSPACKWLLHGHWEEKQSEQTTQNHSCGDSVSSCLLPEPFKRSLCDGFYENRFPFSLNVFEKHFSSYSLLRRLLLAGVRVTGDQFTSSALGDTISPTLLVLVRASRGDISSLSPCVTHLSLPSAQSLL